jgi:integrase
MSAKDPVMTPLPGVQRRSGSTNWQYWKKNPETLLDHPAINGKQWAFRGSLGTSDLREANAKAAAKLAELEAYWATLRASQTTIQPADVTPALVDAIAQRVKAAVLADDERLRGDPVALAESLSYWWSGQERARKMAHERAQREALSESQEPPPYRPLPVPQWLTQEGREELQEFIRAGQGGVALADLLDLLKERHEAAAKQARQALARGNAGPFLLVAEREALALGVNLDADAWTSPEAKPIRDACQRAYLEALEGLAQRDGGYVVDTPVKPTKGASKALKGAAKGSSTLLLRDVVKGIMDGYPAGDYKRKLGVVTDLMLEVVGRNIPAADLKQAHITSFMADVCKLPSDWYTRMKKGEKVAHLMAQEHPKCIAPSTFKLTYRAALGAFLDRAVHEYRDQGFPVGLSIKYVVYKGTREEYEDQQRNFKPHELKRLFESAEYAALAAAPDQAHKYWLPLLALYTGARPRELCQINPQVDYGVRDDIPFFLISEKTEADEGVVKTVKTGEERHVPIHPELVRLGFLAYIDKVKGLGAKRLFPGFGVNKGNPFYRAGSWFSEFLKELGLRDETPKALLSGIYALKKTFITEANRLGLQFEPITGHVEGDRSKVLRDSYIMEEIPLADKLAVIQKVVFDVSPVRWSI